MSETIKQTETNENPGDEVQEVKEGEAQAMTLEEALDQADDDFMKSVAEKTVDKNVPSFLNQTDKLSKAITEQIGVPISHVDVVLAITKLIPYKASYEAVLKKLGIDSTLMNGFDTISPSMNSKIDISTTEKPGEFIIYAMETTRDEKGNATGQHRGQSYPIQFSIT